MAYLARAGMTVEEAEDRRPELLAKAREWQAVENLRKSLTADRVAENQEEAEKVKAEAAKANTEVARDRWRAFLAARKAKDRAPE